MRGAEQSAAIPESGAHVRVLLLRNFAPYFYGNLASNTGTWFQNIAQALLIYRLTGSVFYVGLVNFAQFAGILLLAPWAGSAADRFDRRRLIIVTQLASMLITAILAALSAAGAASAAVVILLALVLGFAGAFATPAQKAMAPTLVDRAYFAGAVTMDSVSFNLSRVAGPVLGVLVIDTLGISWAFALNCLSYAALIAGVLLVHPPEQRRQRGARLRDSIRLVLGRPDLALLLLGITTISLSSDPVNTLSPAFATTVYHRADTLTGFLVGAFGAGAVLSAFLLSRGSVAPFRRLTAMLFLMAAGTVLFGLASSLWLGLGALVVAGFGYLGGQTQATTALQLGVDDDQRGRIMALWSVAYLGTRPIASLADGALASATGVHAATVLMALPVLAAGSGLLLLRNARRSSGDGHSFR